MPLIDLIIITDDDNTIADFKYFGSDEAWFASIQAGLTCKEPLSALIGLVGTDEHAPGIVELGSKLFGYEKAEFDGRQYHLLSRSAVLKELFQETLEKVNEGVQIYDKNGYFLYSNLASQKLGEYEKDDFTGRHLLDIYDLTEEISTTLSVLRTNTPVLNRCDIFKKRDGKELITINSGYPLVIDGKLFGAVSFEGDLTLINNLKNKSFSLEAFIRNEQPYLEKKGFEFEDIVHQSKEMETLINFAKKISLNDTNILITGETGTGKELFAQSIHNYSPRRDQPFVDINCGAVPSNLVESVFFGTEKGAFTGSVSKKGLLEIADGGTLFLDEVNSMSLDMQAKLLRALQENRFQRIGGNDYVSCNIRIIAASNEDLRQLSSENLFRKDLYYRLSSLSLDVPPLRERRTDIQLLLNHFIVELGRKYGKRKLEYTKSFRRTLEGHDWPGNIRELQHAVEYAINHMAEASNILTADDLPDYFLERRGIELKQEKTEITIAVDAEKTLQEQLDVFEEKIIRQALSDHLGNVTKAAESLGLSRQSLQYRMKKFK